MQEAHRPRIRESGETGSKKSFVSRTQKKNVYENSRTCVINNIIDNIWDLVEKTYLK